MRFQVFLSGLVCALLATHEAASARSLDQLGADHLATLGDESYLAQESEPEKPKLMKQEKIGGMAGVYYKNRPGYKEPKQQEEQGGDDCAKLARAAGECTGGKRGGKDADDANKDKDKKDKDDKHARDSYYWSQQDHIRRTNQENYTRRYWEQYNSQKEEEERIRKERWSYETKKKTEEHQRKLTEEREEKNRQW